MSELKTKWPERLKRPWIEDGRELHYERARAEAALERLRVAVEALKRVGSFSSALGDGASVETMHAVHGCLEECAEAAVEALALVGPLPGEQT